MTSSNYLENKINSVRVIAENLFAFSGESIKINQLKYLKLLNDLKKFMYTNPSISYMPNLVSSLTIEEEVGLNLFFGVVNYCFTHPYSLLEYKYTSSKEGITYYRSRAFYTSLIELNLSWRNFDSVLALSEKQWKKHLQVENENQLFEIELRLKKLKHFSSYLAKHGLFSTDQLLDLINFNSCVLLKILIESTLFEDEFLKRAQATTYSISLCLQKRLNQSLSALEKLTFLADYRILQLLYSYGVIEIVDQHLDSKIKKQMIIETNSFWERILRSTVITIGQKIAYDLDTLECHADKVMWEFSQDLVNKNMMSIPHILVATDKY